LRVFKLYEEGECYLSGSQKLVGNEANLKYLAHDRDSLWAVLGMVMNLDSL
jgi:hypothetical protein